MRNISPSHAMVNQAHNLMISGLLLGLAGLVTLALSLLLYVVPLSLAAWYRVLKVGLLVLGGLLLLAAAIQILRGVRVPRENPYALALASVFERFLDYRYTFIRNIGRRGLGYVDALLIGPNGALVIYFLRRKGAFVSERNLWLERSGQTLVPAKDNPTQEAVKDVNALRAFLGQHGLAEVPVYAVIVVVDPQTSITAHQPVVPVTHMHNAQAALYDNYLAAERIRPDQVAGVVRAIMEGLA